MTVVEFHRLTMDALAADINEQDIKDLIKHAHELADMVGWADSIIDKDGKVSEAFDHLKTLARSKHETTGSKNVAILHDAISDLLSIIYRHDDDLTPSTFDDNDDTV